MRQRYRRPFIALPGTGAAMVRHFPGQNTAGTHRRCSPVRRGAVATAVEIILRATVTFRPIINLIKSCVN